MYARNTNVRPHPVAACRVGRETLVPGGLDWTVRPVAHLGFPFRHRSRSGNAQAVTWVRTVTRGDRNVRAPTRNDVTRTARPIDRRLVAPLVGYRASALLVRFACPLGAPALLVETSPNPSTSVRVRACAGGRTVPVRTQHGLRPNFTSPCRT